MAELREESGERCCILMAEHLIGRGPQCALRLTPKYVSTQHAVIRWSGNGWELIDRASRNGTRLNGEPVEPGRAYALVKGAVVSFGHPEQRWALVNASEPQAMALALDSGKVCLENFGMIGIPSTDSPEVTLFKDADGIWRMEDSEGTVRGLRNGQPFEFGGQSYVFSCPSSNDLTASVGTAVQRGAPTLKFVVSSDEDFVELSIEYQNKSVALGSRAHNYLLLTLARQKLADLAEQIAPASCGWMDKDQLAGGLRMTPQQIDGEIFRIRRHFASHGVPESSSVIERRERTRLIRLGLDRVLVERG
ncbi:MAG: FHA domain-containing protein [Pseudomonadota bacterium]